MDWIIVLAFSVVAICFFFFRKPNTQKSVRSTENDQKDNWERFDFYRSKVRPAKGNYRISYEDQRGLTTERDIKIRQVYEHEGGYAIDAYCRLRKAHRSFLEERIKKVINLDTGEIVKNLSLDAIAQHLDSDEGRVLAAIDKERMGASVLLFVCRADGQMRKPERAVVAEYLKKRNPDLVLDDAELDSAIKALVQTEHAEFRRIIRDLGAAGDHDRLVDLLNFSKRIVETQKTVDSTEKAALEILEKAVSSSIP